MKIAHHTLRLVVSACSMALMSIGGPAAAQTYRSNANLPNPAAPTQPAATARTSTSEANDEARGAQDDVDQAVGVIKRMAADPGAVGLLRDAHAVFVVPKYGRAALGIGGRGGVGLLLVKQGTIWSEPVFYNFGGVSAGLQAGVEGGSFVLVLNNDRAVDTFRKNNNWSLNAGAGLTIVDWSKKGQASTSRGDITVWSDTKGLFGGATVSITDIKYDADQTAAYYGKQHVAVSDVIDNSVSNPQADRLKQTLASATSAAAHAGAANLSRNGSPDDAYATGQTGSAYNASGAEGNTSASQTSRMSSGTYENKAK